MSDAKARVWARVIHAGRKTIDDVAEEYQEQVREAYYSLYGEVLE